MQLVEAKCLLWATCTIAKRNRQRLHHNDDKHTISGSHHHSTQATASAAAAAQHKTKHRTTIRPCAFVAGFSDFVCLLPQHSTLAVFVCVCSYSLYYFIQLRVCMRRGGMEAEKCCTECCRRICCRFFGVLVAINRERWAAARLCCRVGIVGSLYVCVLR